MSIHARFDNPESPNCLTTAPIVLRFASLFPRDLKRREMHDKRTGGDLTHVRTDLSHLNTQPVAEPDWIEHIHAEIAAAMAHNFEEEIAARERKGRFREAERLRERGPVDPWKFTRGGPLREGIITVHKLWFGGTGHENWDPDRVGAFKQRANDFLLEHFPGGQLREVDIDEDEEALHFHFAIAVWVEKVSENRGRQWLLQPSANPLLANYEHAQDLAGEAFLDLGIHRGERRAAAARQALAAGVEMPEPRKHVPPSDWRREQRRLALADRDRIWEVARAEATATVADGVALAKGVVKKSRKRSIKEAKARRVETDRHVAAAERDRARAEAQADAARRAKLEAEAARTEADRQAEAAREEAAGVQQAAQADADRIRAAATAAATAEQARAEAARQARTEAEAARIAADQAVAEKTRIANAAQAEAARAAARADALTAGLVALSGEVTAGTLRRRADGEISAAALDVLNAARPEIAPAVDAAATFVENVRAIHRDAADVARTTVEDRKAATEEIARVQQAAEAEADRIRTDAAVVADAEQARADAACQARDEAENARLAADKAATEVTRKAQAEQTEAARAMARADVVTAGLAALTQEMAAGTLGLREGGGVIAHAPDLLRPAYPEIRPTVQAAATAAEKIRAARREADVVTRTADDARQKAVEDITRERAAAASEIDKERETAQAEIEKIREDLDQQVAELEKRLTRVGWVLDKLERVLLKMMKWLSRPELPATMKEEGIGIVREAGSVLGALRQDDPAP